MGDISMIARRLTDGHVQYGWSGNGGTLEGTGMRLFLNYNTPELVEYLFSLGELRFLADPYSEREGGILKNTPTGRPHWLGTSEKEVFSKIHFVDYVYFYETAEQKWYFADPTYHFVVKAPLEWCRDCMVRLSNPEDRYFRQRDTLYYMEYLSLRDMVRQYGTDPAFTAWCAENNISEDSVLPLQDELKEPPSTEEDEDALFELLDKMVRDNTVKRMAEYFDRWTVLDPETETVRFVPKGETHIETVNR